MRANWSSSSSLTNWPLSQYLPLDGVSRQPIRFISVDLPEPEGPLMAPYSLCLMLIEMPRRACTCCSAPRSAEPGRVQAAEQGQQGGRARTRGAQEGHIFGGREAQREAAQSRHRLRGA